MNITNDYQPNNPWKYCMVCGFKKRSNETKINWKGQVVCFSCFETKHPSLNRKPLPIDSGAVRNASPAPTEIFLDYDTRITSEDL